MTNIHAVSIQLGTQNRSGQAEQANKAQFEAMLASFNTDKKSANSSLFGMAESLLDNLMKSLGGDFSQQSGLDFSFTPSFVSTFGTSGPLPGYIAEVSAKLNLSSAQRTAIQDIAVQNKDITKTPENVHKIAIELQAAGIGVA